MGNGYYTPAPWDPNYNEEDQLAQSFSTPGMSLADSPSPSDVLGGLDLTSTSPTLQSRTPSLMDLAPFTGFLDDAIKSSSKLAEGYSSELNQLRSDYDAADKISDGTWGGLIGSVLLPAAITYFGGGTTGDTVSAAGMSSNSYFNNLAADEKDKKLQIAEKLKFTEDLLGKQMSRTDTLTSAKVAALNNIQMEQITGKVIGTPEWKQAQDAELSKFKAQNDYALGNQEKLAQYKSQFLGGSASNQPAPESMARAAEETLGLKTGEIQTMSQLRLAAQRMHELGVDDRFNKNVDNKRASANNSGLFTQINPNVALNPIQQKDVDGIGKSLPPLVGLLNELQQTVNESGTMSIDSNMDNQRRIVAGIVQQMRQFYNQSSRQTQQQMKLDTDELGVKILDGSFGGALDTISQNLRGVDLNELVSSARRLMMNTATSITSNAGMTWDIDKIRSNPGYANVADTIENALNEAGIGYLKGGKTATQSTAAPAIAPTPGPTPTRGPSPAALKFMELLNKRQGG